MKEILIKLREKNRYTQTAMAKLLDVSRQSYMKYETGEVEPPVEVIRKLQKIYNVPYDILIDNKVDEIDNKVDFANSIGNGEHKPVTYGSGNSYSSLEAASPSPAYGPSRTSTMEAAKNTIQNSSLEEFATMLFSVASSLQNANLTLEEKLTKFEVYAKLAEVQMDIANGDKGTDIDTCFSEIMGEKWSKKHIK